jgi:hypothetical protein
VLGVTESRVCQIHTKALRQLRSKLADRPETVRLEPAARATDVRRTTATREGAGRARLQLLAS